MAIEVEFKYEINDAEQINSFVKGLKFSGEKRVVDTYLDTEDNSLFKRGIFIRIRDEKKLEFKYNLTDLVDHEHCNEHSFSLPLNDTDLNAVNANCTELGLQTISSPSLEDFKEKNGLIEALTIDKYRKTYVDDDFEYAVDEVVDLGHFLEVEGEGDDDLVGMKSKMRERVNTLNITLVTTGYVELYWRKHDFDLYLQGNYLLEEDKELKK